LIWAINSPLVQGLLKIDDVDAFSVGLEMVLGGNADGIDDGL
jgi:hypothetical protein